jgi:hypothetical protein
MQSFIFYFSNISYIKLYFQISDSSFKMTQIFSRHLIILYLVSILQKSIIIYILVKIFNKSSYINNFTANKNSHNQLYDFNNKSIFSH